MKPFIEYISDAIRTESPAALILSRIQPIQVRLLHVALGVAGEAGEMSSAYFASAHLNKPLDELNLAEETGDMLWYLALLCDTLGTDFRFGVEDALMRSEMQLGEVILCISSCSGVIVDLVKKHAIYGRDLDVKAIKQAACSMFLNLRQLSTIIKLDIEQVMEMNIKKLKARYPGKWSAEDEQNRNTEAELKAMQQ